MNDEGWWFQAVEGFCRRTDERTDEQTFVIVESLSRLKITKTKILRLNITINPKPIWGWNNRNKVWSATATSRVISQFFSFAVFRIPSLLSFWVDIENQFVLSEQIMKSIFVNIYHLSLAIMHSFDLETNCQNARWYFSLCDIDWYQQAKIM